MGHLGFRCIVRPTVTDRPRGPPTDQPDEERGRSLRQAATLTAIVGAAHAILFIVAYFLLAQVPGPEATDEEIYAYYSSSSGSLPSLVGLYIMPFAAIAFMWFIVALRMWETFSVRRENLLYSNLQLVSGILYVAMLAVGAAAQGVLAASAAYATGPIDPVVARQFPQYGSTILIVFATRMAAIFVFTTSSIGRTAGVLPRSVRAHWLCRRPLHAPERDAPSGPGIGLPDVAARAQRDPADQGTRHSARCQVAVHGARRRARPNLTRSG